MNPVKKQCKVCPLSCHIIVSKSDNSQYLIEGNRCNRGKEYVLDEIINPSRILTSRVLLENGPMSRLPVKTNNVIPVDLVDKCMEIIQNTKVSAPVNKDQIIIKNILNTGVDVVAARRVNKL